MTWNETAQLLIGAAVRAPSSHNTQPWLFRASAAAMDVFADRTRALAVNDPEDRELTISCGCALMNLRAAAAGLGYAAQVQLLPEADPDWLARVTLAPAGAALAEADLATSIEARRTYRKRFAERPVAQEAVAALAAAAEVEGAWLRPLREEAAREELARLVAQGDALLWADPRWRRELAAWMHPRRRGDGLSVPALARPAAQLVVRTFDMGGGVGAKDRELAQGSPLLGMEGDATLDWLRAGQALERVLLTACALGLQASFLNQPVQVAALRPQLARLAGGGAPQMVLRFGYPLEVLAPTPRRPLEAVMESDT